jgi:hypothetical protein
MRSFVILDFDGVLFNSAFEAFSVANRATEGQVGFRQDVSFDDFMAFRGVVTDAWQYNRLYSLEGSIPAKHLHHIQPDDADWTFARRFFEMRKIMMEDPEWPKLMAPYDFFFLVKPLLSKSPDRFAILSTRNVKSIRATLAFHGVDVVPVFGQEDIRRLGSKFAVAQSQHWLDQSQSIVVYVDDMNVHLDPFHGRLHLPLHANWGYDTATAHGFSPLQVFNIINSLLSIGSETKNNEI